MNLFTLFRRPGRPAPVRRARLSLEALDGRWCPDATGTLYPGDVGYRSATADGPPEIIDYEADETEPGLFTITGRVIDEHPGGLTVYFQGPQSQINGQTVTTNPDGTFSLTVQLPT